MSNTKGFALFKIAMPTFWPSKPDVEPFLWRVIGVELTMQEGLECGCTCAAVVPTADYSQATAYLNGRFGLANPRIVYFSPKPAEWQPAGYWAQ
jgi:hypothetical protein